MPMPYGSKLHIPPTNCHLLAAKQELYKKTKKQNKKQKPKQQQQQNAYLFNTGSVQCNTCILTFSLQ